MGSTKVNKPLEVVAAVFFRNSGPVPEILVFQRMENDFGGGHWEFPGGKVELGENHSEALAREIKEELGINSTVGELVGNIIHAYPQKTIHLWVYFCEAKSWNFTLTEHQGFQWVDQNSIQSLVLSGADQPLVPEIFRRLRK